MDICWYVALIERVKIDLVMRYLTPQISQIMTISAATVELHVIMLLGRKRLT